MIFQPNAITADGTPDNDSLLAMRAALSDLKVVMRKSSEYPDRRDILEILTDARAAIDRINAPKR